MKITQTCSILKRSVFSRAHARFLINSEIASAQGSRKESASLPCTKDREQEGIPLAIYGHLF